MNIGEKSLKLHEITKGKISIKSKVNVVDKESLSLAYTPGVAEPCKRIKEDKNNIYKYTSKGNMVAVVTDGSAVLGLGDIGADAALPVMEGKAILFKEFADIDSFPICIDSKDVDTIVNTVKLISSSFGGINLEDISAPRCFEIEERLKKELDIPVFHDDQHGTAIVVLAGLLNSARLLKRELKSFKIVINGAGAAGIAICKLLLKVGIKDIIVCDSKGAIYKGREGLNWVKEEISHITNPREEKGTLKDIIKGKDVFIGVSAPRVLTGDMIQSMNDEPIIFALSNPIPEIMPDVAKRYGVKIVATGRSDFSNQINNVLAFPGIFRGALDAKAKFINDDMKIAAAHAIASIIEDDELNSDYIIPDPFDKRVVKRVSEAVKSIING
ncbi:malate dehydrogenase [Caloranaerobacter azorensis H53214]|uniref:Malate dehydrogenase n=1 Tax=Caloranaerobacter azorensis H53214 TaxID=1156417 RepID=A0A096CWE2_9FIRM|nr:malic enzyme-like NAD(P)-binding protein [Caloranaerobacter azorensis]KGG80894.1 malate dehydrogenase [Caloranaerobacter azorensis H53214]